MQALACCLSGWAPIMHGICIVGGLACMEAVEPTRSQFETTAQHLAMLGWPLQFNTVSYRKSTFRFLCSGMENSPLMLIQR